MTRTRLRRLRPALVLVLVMLVVFGGVYMRARYHSFNWLDAPQRIDVAGRSYEHPEALSRKQVLEDPNLPDGGLRNGVAFNKIGWLPPLHSIYAFGDDDSTKRRVYLEWGDVFYEYGILGGP